MRRTALALPLIFASLAFGGCAATTDGAEGSDGPDGVSSDAITSAAAKTRGFVEPTISDADRADILARHPDVDPGRTISTNLLVATLDYYDTNKALLHNTDVVVIVDFKLNASKARLFLIDMGTGAVEAHKVAAGSGSDPDGDGLATRFSNENNSHMSSLGFVLTGETYNGNHGRSLRLDGLSTTNADMRGRAVVVHAADYVSDASGSAGRSWGCFAVDPKIKDRLVTRIMGGAVLYAGLGDGNTTR